MLSITEFNILYELLKDRRIDITQRELAEKVSVSLGTLNSNVKQLSEKGLVECGDAEYRITERGINALEPYKVKNAIIMAAGMSSRFVPLSYEKPKGLLVVKGEVLIEREIKQLQEAGIDDITIVVGYMKEKFFYLEEKFGVKIVVNEDYYKYNNTSTLIRVTDQLTNTYICSSDNYFVNNVFEKYVYRAYYAAVYADGDTDEYCMTCNKQDRITKVEIGGCNSWYMLGHVYFDKKFSEKFVEILEREYSNLETKEHLWENLYIRYIKELDMYIKKYDSKAVLEFDSLEELRAFDANYIDNADSAIMKNICRILECDIKDIVDIKAIKAGLTNTSFQFTVKNKAYVYRHPGVGTEKYINRRSEADAMKIASELGLDDTYIYMDPDAGFKISRYIEGAREMDYHNQSDVEKAVAMFKKLHIADVKAEYDFGIWDKTLEFIGLLENMKKTSFEGFEELYELLKQVYQVVADDTVGRKCLCHNDCYSPNFLLDADEKMYLIDWEYSGNDDPASDLGTFICCSDYNFDEAFAVIRMYDSRVDENKDLLIHYLGYIAIASYYWYVWALYQESRGNAVGEWLYIWYKNSKLYGKKVIELLQK